MRLQRFLAQAGVSSRRKAEELIASGAVKVNGEVVKTLGTQVHESKDRVELEGKRVRPETPLYRLLLKPRACLATLSEATAADRPTLARYVKDPELGWKVVAPLDFPAEGVVLLTTDGALAQHLSRGGGKLPMTYHLKFQGKLSETELERLRRGWKWEGRNVKPVSLDALATTAKNTWVETVIMEARPRALKAAGELIRHTVLKISRIRMGALSFEGLPMGGSRDLTKVEAAALRKAVGLD